MVCYSYGQPGHIQRDCLVAKGNIGRDKSQANSSAPPPPQKGATLAAENGHNQLYALTYRQEVEASPDIVTGTKGFIVYYDASRVGLGCVLMQNGKVVDYASRQLKSFRGRRKTTPRFPCSSIQHSTSIIPSLPHEIAVEVLSKLPVKSLLQLRCVSKSWLALISCSEFVKIHLQSSANDKEYNHVIIDLICILKDCSLRSIFYDPVTEASEIDYPMKNCVISGGVILSMGICLAGTEKFVGPVRNDKKWPSSGVKLCIWNRRLGSGRNCLNRELCPGYMVEQPDYGKGKFDLMLGVLGSDFDILSNYERSHSDVWVMKDNGVKASRTKMFNINCPDYDGNYDYYPPYCTSFSPFFFQWVKFYFFIGQFS
ncbi:uncharacterized protein LOC124898383 [Capsicum annuum]|uniref:uncharacterized protein LOC124898383 n=1 Tax=Capsicum annuum TaxID=4072 RepID=UPI001FB16939|nr:uncharacterized protein LOC124898383 [Capsicum annuum]